MKKIKKEIIELIYLKQEGAYWDFKSEWYDSKHSGNLLHDIICMSNNLSNRDAYIVIGIDEEKNFEITDTSGDSNRKNTQQLVDFLKNKKFAGDMRPLVLVENIEIRGNTIDVIVIPNSANTPFYLKEKYKGIFANQIYTRIQDTNTPVNSSADIDKVEWLWKKRFGLIQKPIEQVEAFMEQASEWVNGPHGEMQKYYKSFPEYTLTYDYACDGRNGYEYYLFSQCNSTPRWMDIRICYHQTLLTEIGGVLLDGGRYMTPCPETDGIKFSESYYWDIMYKYMTKDSFLYKLNRFLYKNEWTDEARIARDNFLEVILIFEDNQERKLFKEYVSQNWYDRERYRSFIHLPYIPQLEGYNEDAFKQDYENALILKCMLNDFRKRGM